MNSTNENIGEDYIGVGISMGLTSFFGDIDQGVAKGSYISNNSAFGIRLSKDFGSIFALGGEITIGSISGSKSNNSNSKYFKTRFIEYNLSSQYNLMALISKNVNRKLSIYATIGVGLIDFRTKLYDGNNDSIVFSIGYNGEKSTTELAIPIGLKVIYHYSDRSSFILETTSRRIDTDKLDGVEGNNNRDYYNLTAIGYVYKLYPNRQDPNVISARKKKKDNRKASRRNKQISKKESRKKFKLDSKKAGASGKGKKDKKSKKKKSFREK
jgi:opacity protein-like surface antigen